MIYDIEGVDGVGKTSVSQLLAKKLGFKYVKFPTQWYYELIKKDNIHIPMAKAHLHMVDFYQHINDIISTDVVLDRYYPSHLAYEMLNPMNLDTHSWLVACSGLPKPNKIFYLYCTIKKSWQHLKNTGKTLDDIETVEKQLLVKNAYENTVLPKLDNVFHFDIESLSVENVVDEIIKSL